MTTVSIIYFSGAGHTAELAKSVEKGAISVSGVTTHLISIEGKDIIEGRYRNDEVMAKLDESDAIIFGSPTYMGNISAQFKAFADATVSQWASQKWKDKFAAGFTVSGTPSGDKAYTLQYLQTLAMQHAMIWISLGELPMQPNGINRLASWGGAMAMANTEPVDIAPGKEDKLTGEILGKRVANLALKFAAQQ
ncbi:flavodoxin family protein [uncultured Sphingobacterium sp.]|uniref:flavodoxin family protein n=1 Tax=uncultured Sphingobacterium sp. TaxID=182688 RepID=UPI00374A0E24